MATSLRQREILEAARLDGQVGVEALAARFGVAVQTIRRDLGHLAEAGMIERVHGGAVLRAGVTNIAYDTRRRLAEGAKAAIGRAAAGRIGDDSSLILNLGTTTEAVARALMGHSGLTVVTNNMNVAQVLAGNPGAEVVVTGGRLRPADGGLVGAMAAAAFGGFKVDLAVIGVSAIDATGGLYDYDLEEVAVTRAILQAARRVMLVADATKLARVAPVRLCGLDLVDIWVTDEALPPALAEVCGTHGIEFVLA